MGMLHFWSMLRYHYDHSRLDVATLHEAGVRNPREIEEVIEGWSVAERISFEEIFQEMYFVIGFTRNSKPLEVVFILNDDIDVISFGVQRPEVEKIINHFCRYCYSTNNPNN